jgi:DNA-binding MarR family transcriptional regulator
MPLDAHGDLERLVGYNLKRAYVVVSTDFRRIMGKNGLAPRQFSALSLIVQFPKITQSELARKLGIERSGLVAIVDDLQMRKFVSRQPIPGDRRVQALTATAQGQSAYEEAHEMVIAHEATLLSDLSPQEVDILIGLLQRIRTRGD